MFIKIKLYFLLKVLNKIFNKKFFNKKYFYLFFHKNTEIIYCKILLNQFTVKFY